jgi:ferric-dicitrate binding protein FerR (iron transport regulator)
VLTTLTLSPGQQGQLTDRGLFLAANPDIEQVVAWKNGMFLMSNTDLPAIMRQVSRWYDVDVIFESNPTNEKFFGGISRHLPLSEILDLLKNAGVKFRLEGRKLYVRP